MLDKDVVLELLEISQESNSAILESLIKSFDKSGPLLVQEIQEQCAKNDYEMAERAAHKLKGSASMLGMVDLANEADTLMQAARNHEHFLMEKEANKLPALLTNSIETLKSFVSEQGQSN